MLTKSQPFWAMRDNWLRRYSKGLMSGKRTNNGSLFAGYGCRRILAVKGNHDMPEPFPAPIEDLHLKVVEIGGLRIGGFNGCWKYKQKGAFLYDQTEARALMSGMPPVDILLTLNSPRGIHDREDGVHQGFTP